MDLNKSIIVGRATRDAEVRSTSNGAKVASFTLASGALNDHTNFVPVVCWNKKADFAEKFVKRGEKFAVSGRLNQREYEDKEGNKRNFIEIVCEDIYFWGSKGDQGDRPLTQHEVLDRAKDVVIDDFDDKPIDLSEIPF